MSDTLKFSSDSKWREFQGKRYLNCDDYTEEEMAIIADWENAPKEERQEMCRKYGWEVSGGLYTRKPLYGEHDYPDFDWLEQIGFTRDRGAIDIAMAWKRTAKGMVRVEWRMGMYPLRVIGPKALQEARTKEEFWKAIQECGE